MCLKFHSRHDNNNKYVDDDVDDDDVVVVVDYYYYYYKNDCEHNSYNYRRYIHNRSNYLSLFVDNILRSFLKII